LNKFNLKFKNSIQSTITTVNGIQQLSKGCQIATPFGSTCCTTNFCNNEIIQPPATTTTTPSPITTSTCNPYTSCITNPPTVSPTTTTTTPYQPLNCYACPSCGFNNIGTIQGCPPGYSCCVRPFFSFLILYWLDCFLI